MCVGFFPNSTKASGYKIIPQENMQLKIQCNTGNFHSKQTANRENTRVSDHTIWEDCHNCILQIFHFTRQQCYKHVSQKKSSLYAKTPKQDYMMCTFAQLRSLYVITSLNKAIGLSSLWKQSSSYHLRIFFAGKVPFYNPSSPQQYLPHRWPYGPASVEGQQKRAICTGRQGMITLVGEEAGNNQPAQLKWGIRKKLYPEHLLKKLELVYGK